MKTFDAYQLISENEDRKVKATLWWTGTTIKSTDPELLRTLKGTYLPVGGYQFSDGEKFFNALPSLFRSGYEHLKSIKCDETGNEVKDD